MLSYFAHSRWTQGKALWLVLVLALPAIGASEPTACVTIEAPDNGGGGGGGGGVQTVALNYRYPVKCSARPGSGWGAGFGDPNGGCYACPKSNPVRTMASVKSGKACGPSIFKGVAKAGYFGPKKGCPKGDVTQGGKCYYCPAGSYFDSSYGSCVVR